ncbi:MAG: hypothetical protein M1828_005008 [Chrysothrix sp. TS-e1954]|nr:MAG: hypothetical protein M1828_005008 [Chrysothrix sp. TS-e1954]
MLLEEQRFLHEDLERLEQAISDRTLDEPRNIRDRLNRDHQIGNFLTRLQEQSRRLEDVYTDSDGARAQEIQSIGTGDPFQEFYKQLAETKDFHRKYPNEQVENLEKAYRRRVPAEGESAAPEVDTMFTGEEAYGRFFDLTVHHDWYLNLSALKGGRRLTYLQYLDIFDVFTPPQSPVKRIDKLKDDFFDYVASMASYLEDFMKRTKPLEDLEKLFSSFDSDFEEAWKSDTVPGWETETTSGAQQMNGNGDGHGEFWCAACEKEFGSQSTYQAHLTGKKHVRNAKLLSNGTDGTNGTNGHTAGVESGLRLKERAVASREFRIRKLTSSMQTERSDTKVNVERRLGMTDRERQQELIAMYAEEAAALGPAQEGSEDEDDDKIYNPLKLPLAWDGKPIPFWLYKLHGLGVEFSCEICGNYVHMGRRAFDKHFVEPRHIYGLKSLGITNTTMFREITSIADAQKLWSKLQQDKKTEKSQNENVVQMEDAEGNVMPEKVFYDLQKQGLI